MIVDIEHGEKQFGRARMRIIVGRNGEDELVLFLSIERLIDNEIELGILPIVD